MSKTINTQQAQKSAFSALLSQIDSNQPLLLLPLRLETHFQDKAGAQRELRVRIFPDEIFLDYWRDSLTPAEYADGQHFWMQWFIASGSEKREYEAWQVLCDKYAPGHAAWIVRQTRFDDVDKYRPGGALFYRRPYGRLAQVDSACDAISEHLEGVLLDDSGAIHDATGESRNEKILRDCLSRLKDDMAVIDRDIMYCDRIVDYLYDKIASSVGYLAARLDSFQAFYDRYPYYTNNTRTLEAWDADYTLLKSMRHDTRILLDKLAGKRIPLEELIHKYLDDPKNKVFHVKMDKSGKPHAPTVNLLPDRFLLIAEPMDKTKPQRVRFGNPVNRKIKLVPDQEALNASLERGDGTFAFKGPLAWIADYEQACADGMAITLPLEKDEPAFRYIYVLGLSGNKDMTRLEELVNGHNYLGGGMDFISRHSPTNLVDGGAGTDVLSKEEEMRLRFEIEVNDCWKRTDREDARVMASDLKMSFNGSLGRITHFDRKDREKTKIAVRTLWKHVTSHVTGENEAFMRFMEFVGQFLEDHVSAGSIYPLFRIGNVPYGVLPVTDHEKVLSTIKSSEDFMLAFLYKTLVNLGKEWKRLREDGVVAAERLAGADAERDYLKMAGQAPRSLEVNGRWMIDSPLLPDRGAEAEDALLHLDQSDYFRATPVADAVEHLSLDGLKNALRESFAQQGLRADDKELEAQVCEFMDLFTHRLDAWFTGMSYYLLKHPEGRKTLNLTPAVGAYGWVFDLQENRKSDKKNKDEGEFILAPSIQHAMTAAVLRAAYLNTQGVEGDPHMCINLSSMRARVALRMIDGLKNGMSSGVVLGADLERYLHDAYNLYGTTMDAFIYPLRKLFPLTIDLEAQRTEERHVKAANYMMQVVNGEALLNTFLTTWNYNGRLARWLEDNRKNLPWYQLLSGQAFFQDDKAKRSILFQCIERMYDAYDALNDLLLAEGVHRLVAGDDASFTAITRFMAKGTGNLPNPEILNTPLDYAPVAHKTGLILPAGASVAKGRMGQAEPGLNAWVLEKLGSMDHIWFKVEYTDPVETESCLDPYVTLGGLGVEPLEYLYLSGNDHAFQTLLEYRWRMARGKFRGTVRILTGDPAQKEVFEIREAPAFTLYEDSLRISTIRSMISKASVMTVTDFNPKVVSDADIKRSTDMTELSGRYVTLHASLVSLLREMTTALDGFDPAVGLTDEQLGKVLSIQAECLASGVFEAAVPYPAGLSLKGVDRIAGRITYDEILAQQARFMTQFGAVRDVLASRLKAAEAKPLSTSSVFAADDYIAVIQALTLKSFKVLPRFCPDGFLEEEWAVEFSQALREGLAHYTVSSDEFEDWLEEVGSVRPGLVDWKKLSMFQEVAGLKEEVPVILQQRSSVEKNRHWIGLPLPEGDAPDSADSMVLFGKDRVSRKGLRDMFAGLILDGWTEYIPQEDNVAGMVFRYDQPDAEAPQTILLAAFPELQRTDHERWDLDHVLHILDSTRFQMQNRAVDPDLIYHDPRLSKIFPLLSEAPLDVRNMQFVYTSFVAPHIVREKLLNAMEMGIFDYMPGGSILKDFLNDASYEQ